MNYSEEEREFHSDIINDAVDFVEKKKVSLEIPIEEHINLLISYNEHVEDLAGTNDIVDTAEYTKLYEQSKILVRYLIEVYEKTTNINMNTYYTFCKVIEKMMDILFRSVESDELANMFKGMKM